MYCGFTSLNSSLTISDYGCSSRISMTGFGFGHGRFSPGCFGFGFNNYFDPFSCGMGYGWMGPRCLEFEAGMGLGYLAGSACKWAIGKLFNKNS